MKHPWKRASYIVPESVMELDREEVIITNCFEKGYHYEKIIIFQSKFHGINISFRTLKKKDSVVWSLQETDERYG